MFARMAYQALLSACKDRHDTAWPIAKVRVVMRMGLVSMILELRKNADSDGDETGGSGERQPLRIETKVSSPEAIRTQETISLRTFALRLNKQNRRRQPLG